MLPFNCSHLHSWVTCNMWSTWELKWLFICFQYTIQSSLKVCLIVKHSNSEQLKLTFLYLTFRAVYLYWVDCSLEALVELCLVTMVQFFNSLKSHIKVFVLNSKIGPDSCCEWAGACQPVWRDTGCCRQSWLSMCTTANMRFYPRW